MWNRQRLPSQLGCHTTIADGDDSQAMLLGNRRWLWYAGATCVAALLIGGGTAWALRKPFLLDVPRTELPPVEVFGTAEQQFLYARSQGTEAAWQSVIDNFNDRLYVPQAEEQLALLYLKSFENQQDREKAAQLFEHMAKDYPDIDMQWRATGLAGQAIVYSLDSKAKESEQKLLELDKLLAGKDNAGNWDTPQAQRYLDPQMIQMLHSIASCETAKHWATNSPRNSKRSSMQCQKSQAANRRGEIH